MSDRSSSLPTAGGISTGRMATVEYVAVIGKPAKSDGGRRFSRRGTNGAAAASDVAVELLCGESSPGRNISGAVRDGNNALGSPMVGHGIGRGNAFAAVLVLVAVDVVVIAVRPPSPLGCCSAESRDVVFSVPFTPASGCREIDVGLSGE